jgi:Mg-chelatase subunit ChlD
MLDAYIVLDRSGSMTSNWAETIGSINGYVEGLKKAGTEATLTLIAFDDSEPFLVVRDAVNIDWWSDVSVDEITPRGFTPLYDALGKTLQRAEQTNSDKVVVVVVTDGAENASREFTLNTVKAAITRATDEKHWEVLFLSADLNFNAQQYTNTFGLGAGKFINTSNATRGTVMANLAIKTSAYSAAEDVVVGATAMNFTEQEQKEAEEKK